MIQYNWVLWNYLLSLYLTFNYEVFVCSFIIHSCCIIDNYGLVKHRRLKARHDPIAFLNSWYSSLIILPSAIFRLLLIKLQWSSSSLYLFGLASDITIIIIFLSIIILQVIWFSSVGIVYGLLRTIYSILHQFINSLRKVHSFLTSTTPLLLMR